MEIRFDPRLPLVWRDPQTLQVGVDRPRVVLAGLTARHERIVSAIAAGHGRSGTAILAHHIGCGETEIDDAVALLAPALVTSRSVTAPTVEVAGSGPVADELVDILVESGVDVRRASRDLGESLVPPDLGVAISSHVHDPVVSGAWLRRDIAHLQIVVGDAVARVGPVVVPGETACARCLDLFRAEVDDCWGVIAAQLWGRVSPSPGPVLLREIAARAARRVIDRFAAAVEPLDDAVLEMVALDTGEITRSTSRPHPGCGCAALPESGSDAARASLGSGPGGSTRDSGVASLG